MATNNVEQAQLQTVHVLLPTVCTIYITWLGLDQIIWIHQGNLGISSNYPIHSLYLLITLLSQIRFQNIRFFSLFVDIYIILNYDKEQDDDD